MRSKIISIGDEILIGQIVNTNAAYIGEKLFVAGFPVEKTVVIGDEENILFRELKDSMENYDITIITGGIGPTHDDITKPTLVKFFNDKLTLGFAGSLTKNKGVDIILEAITKLKYPDELKEIIFAGDSIERKKYEEAAFGLPVKINFKGSLSRQDMEKFYESVDLIILPSESEGFPKVIAEAAAYGCVPIVSDISSIGQYFNETNGFLLKKINSDELAIIIDTAVQDRNRLKKMSIESTKVAELFTFERYLMDLKTKVLESLT